MVLVPKNEGSVRFCVDYRMRNAATVPKKYRLLHLDDCLDILEELKSFNTLMSIMAIGNTNGQIEPGKDVLYNKHGNVPVQANQLWTKERAFRFTKVLEYHHKRCSLETLPYESR